MKPKLRSLLLYTECCCSGQAVEVDRRSNMEIQQLCDRCSIMLCQLGIVHIHCNCVCLCCYA